MAAVQVVSELRGGFARLFQRARLLTTVYRTAVRGISSSSDMTTETPKPTAPPPQKEEPFDNSTYKVTEYFSYNESSFYDIECEIDDTGKRQRQPDPSVPYQHTEPWKKEAKS